MPPPAVILNHLPRTPAQNGRPEGRQGMADWETRRIWDWLRVSPA